MIVNLEKFVREESVHWRKLDGQLTAMANDPWKTLSTAEVLELERLYQRAAADLARLQSFAAEPEARRFLESVVSRAYSEIHGGRAESRRFRPFVWLVRTFPQTWRRRSNAFLTALSVTLAGVIFGGAALAFDTSAKKVLMPFSHLQGRPSERVAREEASKGVETRNHRASFSGMLMTHNTQVTLSAMALGMTAGVGTLILMLYNGAMIGAVATDYVLDGQTRFLLGWLLPHGVIEIPAMLVGGQAGLVLAGALLGRGRRESLADRLRAVTADVVTLCFGAALMLVWAGIVESFLSQYHEPVLPYAVKIAFGVVELALLGWYLGWSGRKPMQRV